MDNKKKIEMVEPEIMNEEQEIKLQKISQDPVESAGKKWLNVLGSITYLGGQLLKIFLSSKSQTATEGAHRKTMSGQSTGKHKHRKRGK